MKVRNVKSLRGKHNSFIQDYSQDSVFSVYSHVIFEVKFKLMKESKLSKARKRRMESFGFKHNQYTQR